MAHKETVDRFDIDPDNFELRRLSSLPCAISAPQTKWNFDHKQHGEMVITPNVTLQANDLMLVIEAAIKTRVLAYVPTLVLHNITNRDCLMTLNGPDWQPQKRALYAVYSASRRSSQKVKSVIRFAKDA